ncbi:sirohydrochlorin chelatase [Chitinimonas naiadis]
MSDNTAIILFAHGARDPQWAEPFQQIARLVAQRQPASRVKLAFLELMAPNLADCVAELARDGCSHILVCPVFMARGAHLRRDLPALIDTLRLEYPQLDFEVTEAIGESPQMQIAMADWIVTRNSKPPG